MGSVALIEYKGKKEDPAYSMSWHQPRWDMLQAAHTWVNRRTLIQGVIMQLSHGNEL
jgi:hypothetical protein